MMRTDHTSISADNQNHNPVINTLNHESAPTMNHSKTVSGHCPNCNHKIKISRAQTEQPTQIQCPNCKRQFYYTIKQ